MDRKNNYQRIEFLASDAETDRDIDEKEVDLYTSSQQSSSPPRDFSINLESQYIPIFDENDSPNPDINQKSSSLASSLSIESHHDYTNPAPTTILTNTSRIIRCPVCEKPMRTFYCAKCIQRGQFVTLDKQASALDKQFSEFTKNFAQDSDLFRPHTIEDFGDIDEEKCAEQLLQVKLRTLTKRMDALKRLYRDQKLKFEETENVLKQTKRELDLERRDNNKKESKIKLIEEIITGRKESIRKRRNSENNLMEDMKQHVNRRVFQLTTDVFPIEEVNLLEYNNSLANMEASPLLTFSSGSYHQFEQQTAYSIVEPWLPINGDYNAYGLWVNDNQDHIPASMSDLPERNPAYRIGAGLAYTTQLVKNLASYLDVILPARMDNDTFSRELLNDPQFSYNVAKLNTNVIHLCVSQGVDVSLLNPQRTLKNLMLLFNLNISDLGRKPIIELVDNEEAAARIEEQLVDDLSLIKEKFYDFSKFADDEDVSDSEWEISDNINPMEMQLATEQSIQQNSYISRLPSLRLFTSFWSTGNS